MPWNLKPFVLDEREEAANWESFIQYKMYEETRIVNELNTNTMNINTINTNTMDTNTMNINTMNTNTKNTNTMN